MALRYRAGKANPYRTTRRAAGYQAHDDPTRKLAEKHKPAIRRAIKAAFKEARSKIDVKAIAEHARRYSATAAADMVNVASLRHGLIEAFKPIAALFQASGENGAKQIRAKQIRKARTARARRNFAGRQEAPEALAFSMFDKDTVTLLSELQDALITAMTDDIRRDVLDTIIAGVRDARDVEEMAAAIRDSIGLNAPLARAVENYRAALEDASARALNYQLRADTYDAEVRAALDQGVALSPGRINDLVDAYVERALDYRADMIAQTESNRAANLGLQESYRQAIADGVFTDAQTKQVWMVAMDERTCEVCQGIADDNPDGIGMDETFDSEDGPVDGPPVHPNCRCTIEIHVDLGGLRAPTQAEIDAQNEDEAA